MNKVRLSVICDQTFKSYNEKLTLLSKKAIKTKGKKRKKQDKDKQTADEQCRLINKCR